MKTSSLSSLSSQSSLTEPVSVFEQLREFRSKIPKDLLTQWEKPTGFRCLLWDPLIEVNHLKLAFLPTSRYIAQDWGIILSGHQLYIQRPSVATFITAIVLMAWGHRGLSNLAHDSIHRNLIPSRVYCSFNGYLLKKLTDSLGLEWYYYEFVPRASADEHCTASTPDTYCSPPLSRH